MAFATLELGSVVVNFGLVCQVVGLFKAADGYPCAEAGWPILRELREGRPVGGKWVADPAKCSPARVVEGVDAAGRGYTLTYAR